MKTLVYHSGALGDFITILPMLKIWQNNNLFNTTTLLGKPSFYNLIKYSNIIKNVWNLEERKFAQCFNTSNNYDCIKQLNQFDTAFLFTSNNSQILKIVQKSDIKNIKHQAPFPNNNRHIVDYHLDLIKELRYSDNDLYPQISLPQNNIKNNKLSYIAIAPGSGSVIKNWPLSSYIDLDTKLKKLGYNTIWILGPAENNLKIPQNITIVKNKSLINVAMYLHNAIAYIGNDSGITHLSASVGCKTIALFGASDSNIWQPIGKNIKIITSNICTPCHGKLLNPKCNKECMNSISVNKVLNTLLQIL